MALSIANPFGLLALFGVPTLLAIHMLRRRSRRVVATTLFLLVDSSLPSAKGSVFERLHKSVLLCLQIVAVLLLTWLLIAPRWLRADSHQRIVIVVDCSASMSVFRAELERALDAYLTAASRLSARTEWVVIASDPKLPTLYSGGDVAAARAAAVSLAPTHGQHDSGTALSIAQTLAGIGGQTVFLTDHIADADEARGAGTDAAATTGDSSTLQGGVTRLAVGRPTDNVGFVGAEIALSKARVLEWRAVVKSSSRSPQRRHLRLEADGVISPLSTLELAPGELSFLSGTLPVAPAFTLVIDADDFTIDDRLPLVRPQPKPLRIAIPDTALRASSFVNKWLDNLVPVVETTDNPDLLVMTSAAGPLSVPGEAAAVVFLTAQDSSAGYLGAPIQVSADPLVADVNWRGLLVRPSGGGIERQTEDRVLVQQGDRALLFVRGDVLVVNFALETGNATHLPAFVLTLHRFVDSVRLRKVAYEQRNVETHQLLTVAANPAQAPLRRVDADGAEISVASGAVLAAPERPGVFEVRQGSQVLLRAAAHFGDTREGDLRGAASTGTTALNRSDVKTRNSQPDPLTPVWLVSLLAILLATWRLQERSP